MVTYYQSSNREEQARQRLYDYNVELRAIVLDLLSVIGRASNDPWPVSVGMPMGEAEELRRRAFDVEHRDAIIRRARRMIDTTADAGRYIGPLRTESAQKPQPSTDTNENKESA